MSRQTQISRGSWHKTLLSAFGWFLALHLIPWSFGTAEDHGSIPQSYSEESFQNISCKGTYDVFDFGVIDRVCEDCSMVKYVHYDHQVHLDCRKECYSTDAFPECLQDLGRNKDQEKYRLKVERLGGKGFRILPPVESTKTAIAKRYNPRRRMDSNFYFQ